ncbi:MAG: hypothetical protein ABFR62_09630 [Bacteroidota bacterium]
MKRVILLFVLALGVLSCNNDNDKAKTEENSNIENKEQAVLSVDQLLEQKETLVDKEVVFKGTVDHVCKHSGKRAFVFGSSEDLRIKIEAGGEITGFDAELIGGDIEVKGTLKEFRIDEAYINQLEDDMKEEHDGKGDGEGHEEEEEQLKKEEQVKKLRQELALTDKGYKSVYHVDGISFRKLD